MSFHYPTVNYQIPLHFRLKRGEPPLNESCFIKYSKVQKLTFFIPINKKFALLHLQAWHKEPDSPRSLHLPYISVTMYPITVCHIGPHFEF